MPPVTSAREIGVDSVGCDAPHDIKTNETNSRQQYFINLINPLRYPNNRSVTFKEKMMRNDAR